MDPDQILVKTDKGRDEIATRRRKLPSKMRALLILIDGKKSVKDLVKLHPGSVDLLLSLRQLRDRKYIRALSDAATEDDAPHGEPDPATGPVTELPPELMPAAEDIGAARALAVRLLREAMGPDAANFASRLERCASGDDLLAHAQRYAIVLGTMRGKEFGDRYLQQVRAALQPA